MADIGESETYAEIDLSGTSWEYIFQDIVRRSPTLDCVTIVSAFTCTKMRRDGFGGMAVLITADAIEGKSTNDVLEDFLAEAEGADSPSCPISCAFFFGSTKRPVRNEIACVIEADVETLTTPRRPMR